MPDLLPDRLPWFVAGPLIGLLIVGLYAVQNKPLGATSAYANVIALFGGRSRMEVWRVWYFVGILAGALLAALLQGNFSLNLSYGALGRVLSLPALIPLLFLGGILMGYGARWAGGCTSGHGLCGTSVRSAGSFAATITFMLTAIGVTFLVHFLTGGALRKSQDSSLAWPLVF
jgi:uncharacterized membrane protein YedE/YeeE